VKSVLIVLPSLAGGGAERVMVGLANALATRRCDVTMLVVSAENNVYENEVDTGVSVVYLHRKRMLSAFFLLRSKFSHQKDATVITTMAHSSIVCWFAKVLSKNNANFIAREAASPATLHPGKVSAPLYFYRYLVGFVYRHSEYVVSTNAGMFQQLLTYYGIKEAKLKTIPNPVDMSLLLKYKDLKPQILADSTDLDRFILAVGRLEPIKDYPTLLRSFSIVCEKISDINLVILGEGSERDVLEKLALELGIEDRIFMLGFIDNPFYFMNRCDLFVLSSIYEGFPNVLVQALSSGVACVSTDCPPGATEILSSDSFGDIVPVGDHRSMGNKIAERLQNNTNRLSKKDKEKVLSDYDMSLFASRFYSLL